MKKMFVSMLFLLSWGAALAQPESDGAAAQAVTFRFVAGKDMFYSPWLDNEAELERLFALVDAHRGKIGQGHIPIRVQGYCSSMPTAKENLALAFIRSNRVKSELITRKGLKEADFYTTNYARPLEGRKDVVIVTVRLPAPEQPKPAPKPAPQPPAPAPQPAPEPAPEPAPAPQPEPAPAPAPAPEPAPVAPATCCIRLDVRTNLLYDALLLPTLGVEWRVNRHVGIKVDASRSWWGDKTGKVQKIWLVSPEVRWYLLQQKRFYAGVSANFGQYNVYKYALGGLLSKDTGYQGSLWGAGLTVGYRLPIARRLALDFNLGLGYTRYEYDSFTLVEQVRIAREREQTRNFWGPTQAGVSLVWRIGAEQ